MIHLTFTVASPQRIPAHLWVLPFFKGERPLRGYASAVDWKLAGRISAWLKSGWLTGDLRERLWLPTGGRLMAQELLFCGLGEPAEFKDDRPVVLFEELARTLSGKGEWEIVFSLQHFFADFWSWRGAVRGFVFELQRLYHERDIDVWCCEGEGLIQEAKRRSMDFGMNVGVRYDLSDRERRVA